MLTNYLWIIFALLSAISAALVAIFGKIGLQNIDTNTATAIRSVIMALFLVSIILFQGKASNIQPILENHKALLFIILSGVAGAISWLFYFWALKLGKAYQGAALDRLSMVFVIIFAAILLAEKVGIKAILGAVMMVAGAILISLK